MTSVDVQVAASQLPDLLDRVEQGELVSITRTGACPVDLVPRSPRSRRAAFYGAWKGRVDMSRFDEADEEIAREFGLLDRGCCSLVTADTVIERYDVPIMRARR